MHVRPCTHDQRRKDIDPDPTTKGHPGDMLAVSSGHACRPVDIAQAAKREEVTGKTRNGKATQSLHELGSPKGSQTQTYDRTAQNETELAQLSQQKLVMGEVAEKYLEVPPQQKIESQPMLYVDSQESMCKTLPRRRELDRRRVGDER